MMRFRDLRQEALRRLANRPYGRYLPHLLEALEPEIQAMLAAEARSLRRTNPEPTLSPEECLQQLGECRLELATCQEQVEACLVEKDQLVKALERCQKEAALSEEKIEEVAEKLEAMEGKYKRSQSDLDGVISSSSKAFQRHREEKAEYERRLAWCRDALQPLRGVFEGLHQRMTLLQMAHQRGDKVGLREDLNRIHLWLESVDQAVAHINDILGDSP